MSKNKFRLVSLFMVVCLLALCSASVFADSTVPEREAPQPRATFPSSFYSTSSSSKVALRIFSTDNPDEYLNVYSSSGIVANKPISTWGKTNDTTQKFIIYNGSDGLTTIRMYDDVLYAIGTDNGGAVLRYIPDYNTSQKVLNTLLISNIHSENYSTLFYGWVFDVKSDSTSLTASNVPTAVSGGYKVTWYPFASGNNRQIWHVEKY